MQHLYPQQHGSNTTTSAHHSASEIEAFRARQRTQFRFQQQQLYQHQQQHLQSLHTGNQAEEYFSSAHERVGDEQDDRVRKVSLTKQRQQLQQRLQQQQQQAASSNRQATKLPNFGVDRRHPQQQRHHHHQHQHQYQLHNQYVCEDDIPSPMPHEAHVMFNAFDFGNSPEAFTDQQHHDNNNYENNNGGEGDQQMQQENDEDGDCEDTEKSIWRRRFAADDAHLRRLPKLGQDALWDSPSSVGSGGHYNNYTSSSSSSINNNQFSHQHQYGNSSHLFYQQ